MLGVLITPEENDLMTRFDKDSKSLFQEVLQRIIRYATEPIAITGKQACQTSYFN
jgi:hypothetical protein